MNFIVLYTVEPPQVRVLSSRYVFTTESANGLASVFSPRNNGTDRGLVARKTLNFDVENAATITHTRTPQKPLKRKESFRHGYSVKRSHLSTVNGSVLSR